jgi:hypothetical protein
VSEAVLSGRGGTYLPLTGRFPLVGNALIVRVADFDTMVNCGTRTRSEDASTTEFATSQTDSRCASDGRVSGSTRVSKPAEPNSPVLKRRGFGL